MIINPEQRVISVIPTLDEENTIGDLLHEISRFKLPVQVSALVIDGGSSDNTGKSPARGC
jgi:glycosyltransferase involved in cell wall biosynthesis